MMGFFFTLLISLATSSSELYQVEWYAPFLSGGGYSSEAVAFVIALARRGRLRLKIEQHGDGLNADFVNGLPRKQQEVLGQLFAPPFNRALPTITICHSEPGAWNVLNGPMFQTTNCPRNLQPSAKNFLVARTMFEADSLPEGWKERLNSMNEVWVPTEFHRQIFERDGVDADKLWVVGEPVDTDFFDPDRSDLVKTDYIDRATSSGEQPFVFLSIFKWEERKGWKFLLKAFILEFQQEENVILAILTNAYHSSSKFEKMIREFIENDDELKGLRIPSIQIVPSAIPQQKMPSLYREADCFVLPTRGEGWGRPIVEAMSLRLPVIATFWSGMTAYMTDDNSFPVQIEEQLAEIPSGAFKGLKWATPKMQSLRDQMRLVTSNREEANRRAVNARMTMIEKFCLDCLAVSLEQRFELITNKMKLKDEL